ncbi:PilT protein domain protein [Xylanimonas cellulosilytica DSM 15894]|uniref:Ribonuclease VapC n=1 Tax=Xylanimonas cellulosilytica (strain DSM 15894 / JCM 12276 / CECT 5975 / KCTC 9989 / LMG 20990 / NBRC 107835 / XIL07) TaxID=446471 RepID=D1C0G1_XYLCX|nr:type II toxin-antitoxin system VapC family toxin [Xylanimonas cellulosilytica]ACZ32164.1 PilT protein domain protein [Xylanimonas cellulosilytica DSM 15894]
MSGGLVVDASALAEYLVSSAAGQAIGEELRAHDGALHVPHLAVVETVSVLRGLVLGGFLTAERAAAALADLADLPAERWPSEPLLPRIWELRSNLSAYDATYVALAEALDADVVTRDARLARGAQTVSRCTVRVVGDE